MARYTIFVPHPSNFLTDHRPSGDGLLAWSFLERLAARGHRIHVACQRVDVAAPVPENLRLYPLSDAPKLLTRERLRYMRRVRRLYRAIGRRERIDLVHQLNPVDLGITLALPRAAPPVVLGPYVPDWAPESSMRTPAPVRPGARTRLAHAARDLVRAHQQRRAALILLSTPAAAAKLTRRPAGTRTAILSPGIESGRFRPADGDPAHADGRPPTILFLAHLQVRKGALVLLEAFEAVAGAVPDARLLLAGTGPEEGAIRDRLASSPAGDRVTLAGNVGREAIAATLAAADVFCLPSFGEPFGISALEAMAAGLPVVSTNAGGLAHLVPAAGGIKVPPRDPAALADALIALLRDPARRAAMGRANRAAVAHEYEWDRVIDRLEGFYTEIVERRCCPSR